MAREDRQSVGSDYTEWRTELDGKVAIVTGAHGIGRAIAERYGAEGAMVVVCDVDAAGGEAVAGITDAGGTAVAIVTDVSDKAAVDRLFDETLDRFGAVDVLVNNAGWPIPSGTSSRATRWWIASTP